MRSTSTTITGALQPPAETIVRYVRETADDGRLSASTTYNYPSTEFHRLSLSQSRAGRAELCNELKRNKDAEERRRIRVAAITTW